jgi:alpha-tubulin suppressor-like RCC1 family protein
MGKNDRGQLGNGSGLERGLVGWWKFDGDATDSSGNGNDGTVNGATLTTDRHGLANGAYSFDGVDDYIQTPESNKFSIQDQITVSFWFELNSFEAGNFIQKGNSSTGWEWELWTGNGTTSTGIHLANGLNWHIGAINSDQQVDLNKYSNLAMVFDASNFLKLYLDGKLVGYSTSFNSSFRGGLSPLFIGARKGWAGHDDPFRPFNGSIDEIRIYNRALSSTEVSALYTLESQPFSHQPARVVDANITAIASGSETSYFIKNDGSLWGMGRNDRGQLGNAQGLDQGLVGWWKFDGDATDSSSNGNDGTVNGATLTTDRHGKANGAYSFDGLDDYIDFGDSEKFDNRESQSIFLWVKFLSYGGNSSAIYSPVLTKAGVNYTSSSFYFFDNGNSWKTTVSDLSSVTTLNADHNVSLGQWEQVGVVLNSGEFSLYVQGTLRSTDSSAISSIANSPSSLKAGAWYHLQNPSYPTFNGTLDDIRIYDRALSASEVSALYTLESEPEDPSSPVQIVEGNVTAVSSRGSHALFQKKDGSLWAMGANNYGQLGDGTTTDRHTPMQVFAWEEKASNSLARSAFDGVEVMDGKLYFAGGYSGLASAVFESFDPSTGSWQTLPSLATARIGISMAAYNGKLYVFGGSTANGSNNKLDSMEIYNSDTNSWSAGPNLPVACNYSVAVTYGDKILVFGGWDQPQDNMDQVLEFDPSLNTWSSKTSMPVGRSGMKAVVFEGKVWLMGGLSGSGNEYSNRVDVYDPATDTWSQMPDLTVARHWALAWTLNGKVYIGGGRPDASTYLTTIESYDSSSNQWRIIGNLPDRAYQSDSALINGKLYLTGGYDGSAHSDKLYMTDLNPVTAFSAGGDHSRFVQADGSLWAMGRNHAGQIGDGTTTDQASPVKVVNSGVAEVASGLSHGYYLTTNGDLWAMGLNADGQLGDGTTTNRNSPVQVLNGSNVSQVSAGSKEGFFVQGDGTTWAMGRNDFGQLGKADTASQSTPAMVFGWEEKASHSQARYLYDGVEVIDGKLYLAGGVSGTVSDTLERYDPNTDQWTTLASMTQARYGHLTAVHNGLLYVLGGADGTSTFSSVEIYDPSTNSWTAGVALLSPLGRAEGILIGNKILVVGGENSVRQELTQVLEFDLNTNLWTTKASLNEKRHGHVCAYFDGKIWAMGGMDESQELSSVEIYDPASDDWTSGPSLNTERLWSVAWVSNGRLYVGGGRNLSGTYLHSIESYNPVSNSWEVVGNLPVSSYVGEVGVIGNQVYLAVGSTSGGVYSDKLYVSDLSPLQAVASNGNSNPNTILIKQDGTFWGMGRNDSGQIGDGSLTNRSYPVPIISSYTLVVNGAAEGNATGGGEWSIGSPVTLIATPNPGYLFAGWVGDLNSTDANVTLSPSGDLEVNATFVQDLNDNDDDNLTNFYEIVTLGTNADNNDTDGDGLLDGEEVGILGIDPLINNAPIVALFAQREIDAYNTGLSEGNTSGQQYVYDYRSTFSLYNQAEVNASAQQRESNGSRTGEPLGRLYVQTNPGEFSLYTEADLNASMVSERVRGLADGNQSGKNQVTANPSFYGLYTVTEINATITSESIRGLADGNASGKAYVQTKRVIYSLYNGVDLNVSGTQFYSNAYAEGNTSGINYVNLYPNLFNLYTETDINNSRILSQQVGFNEGNLSGIAYLQANARQYGWYHISDKLQLEADARIRALVDGNTAGVNQVKNNPHSYDLNTTVEKEAAEGFARSDGLNKGFSSGVQWAVDHPSQYSLYLPAEKVSLENSAYGLAKKEGDQVGKDYVVNNRKFFDWINPVERTEMETNASRIAREAGRLSGIEKVKNSPNDYSLYSLADRNQKEAQAYSVGFTEGNASGIAYVFSNRLSYGLSADIERDARILDSRQRGESEGIKAGRAQSVATAQADLSRHGLALVEYLETTEPTPYTYNWFYQPGAGWLWTDKSVFPYFYLSSSEGTQTGWLYYDSNRTDFPFYDYQRKTWKEIEP